MHPPAPTPPDAPTSPADGIGTDWGICTTVKAPAAQVQAFVAYHLGLGAAHIWLHFDDPDDPAAGLFDHPAITVIRCSDAYWMGHIGRRPPKHQNRQARNVQRVYALTDLPWLAHIDVDEYITSQTGIRAVLDHTPPDQPMLRMGPMGGAA